MNFNRHNLKMEDLSDNDLMGLIENENPDNDALLFKQADYTRREIYGTDVYVRGLIEFTNYCQNHCLYCGIRAGNPKLTRYRLEKERVLDCCKQGYALGLRTFVLQGGEDAFFTDAMICGIVAAIKENSPGCAVTLSIGEKPYDSYKAYFDAGADRYLLRHETANPGHYKKLHPGNRSADQRKECLWNLKTIGYQVGSGFLVGAPYQTTAHIVEDLRFLQQLKPDMIGIGPFIAHADTPFKSFPNGNLHTCLRLIALLRLMFPYALIPATTALGTIHPQGREQGLKAGANVVMPNLSPMETRKLYTLYDNKIYTSAESAEGLAILRERIEAAGYTMVMDVGHVKQEVKP